MADEHSIRSAAYWTEDRLREAAYGYGSITEFARGNNRAYKRALRSGFLHELFTSKICKQFTEDDIREAAKRYGSASEFARGEPSMYNAAIRLKIIGGLFVSRYTSWTIEKAEQAALKCSSKTEFKTTQYQAYAALLRAGRLDEFFNNKLNTWNFDLVAKEAEKYKTRTDFAKNAGSAYIWALRNQVIERLIPEVSDGHNTRDCVYIWAADECSGIYKVGVTSQNKGDERIRRVATKSGYAESAKIVVIRNVGSDLALRVEAKLKTIGTKHKFNRVFDGCTEFRVMTPDQLASAVSLINQH